METATIQILIMLLGSALLGALVYRLCFACDCACRACSSDADTCGACGVCVAGTCAAGACNKKCNCGAKKSVVAAMPVAAAQTVHAAHAVHTTPVVHGRADDLVIIEGIGPAINKVLNAHGVHTFAQLVTTPKETIHEWLNEAGPQFKFHDASTWAEQAALARDGKMVELDALKVKLDNGQHV